MVQITGKVVHGDHYGKALGFPTANLDRRSFSRRKLKVKLGVWGGGVRVVVSDKQQPTREYQAAIVIGPQDRKSLPKIEAHLIGFNGNLYGKRLVIILGRYLRAFKKFKSETELKKQIAKDVALIKKMKLS